jgi:V/A-type H+-transporting ATPase subunit I
MNLLGAFIHNSRLQYVEFFGKFYEGEGELFAPLGQTRRFVGLQR